MNLTTKLTLSTSLILCSGAPAADAQEVTATHATVMPLVLEPFQGSIVFATVLAPAAGENIVRTQLVTDWTTNGVQSAALFGMHLSANHEQGHVEWSVTGGDLGWGAPAGTYSTAVVTGALNGTVAAGFLPLTTFDLAMEAAGGGGLWGILSPDTKIIYYHGPRMDADQPAVSLVSGGVQSLALNAGPTVGPGLAYIVLGSATATAPGLELSGVHIPLAVDAYTNFTLTSANQGPLVGTLGVLDGAGRGTAQISIPAATDPGLAGTTLYHSMLLLDLPAGALLSASEAVALTLAP
ncbi:hypothetical protein [Engelhardtia mirabilis]|uniref:Uncharacterized protein n=1 Tax=Engelhardtia mirabilis TaxID=2528011 RepID=A0A518BEH5_9BACT|nr:hypothetical protein Pla133_04530 [Planctomycetes bacterium Pla133]QDU99714.1 hypothetical protein Pla86_04530 [Planctomycetes bacterium Pla86]